jgi:hypothetical protein
MPGVRVEGQRRGWWQRTAALQQAQLRLRRVFTAAQGKAQRRRRRIVVHALRPEGDAERLPRFRSHLQAAQFLVGGMALQEPAEHRAAAAGAQRLFHRPQRFLRRGFDDMQLRQAQARRLPGRRIDAIGRGDQQHRPPGLRELREHRLQQRQLAQAVGAQQHFHQRRFRPAAAGQRGIERFEAAGTVGKIARGRFLAAPQAAFVQQGLQGSHDGGHQAPLTRPQYKPSIAKSASAGTRIGA